MAFLKVSNVAIRGISACVPPYVEENRDIPFYTAEEAEKVIETTGVERKHIVKDGITASDLCLKAAEKLINELKWERESIDAICYVTQTPDYLNQPTGFVIHDKMNLSADCMVLDLFHGCPGWVVGLNTLSSLMSSGSIKRALLLDGDNVTLEMIALDRESRPLFGDCGTVTALEFDESAPAMYFNHGTNSKDGKALIHNEGGSRNPYTMETVETELRDEFDRLERANNETWSLHDDAAVAEMRRVVDQTIRMRDVKAAHEVLQDLSRLITQIALPAVLVGFLQQHQQQFGRYQWRNAATAKQLLNQGMEMVNNNPDWEEVRQVCVRIIDLLPIEEQEKVQL